MAYTRLENESDEELIYRVCQDKEIIGSWQAVADILNKLLGAEYTESKYRKQYQAFQKMLDANGSRIFTDDDYLQEIKEQQQELKKERQKLSDERVELNKRIREEARKESFEEMIKRVVSENTPAIEVNVGKREKITNDYSNNDVLAHFTDLHTGIEIDNYFNQFDESILFDRVNNYTDEIIRIGKFHKSENCYIVVSELLSGIIHNNLRIQNNMDLMEQFKSICNLLAYRFIELSQNFKEVYVYTVMGNHSRISPKKEDSLQGENMDILFPFYMKARLQNYKNIHIEENKVCDDIAMFSIRGNNVFAVHGDKDSPQKVVENMTMLFGIKPDIVLTGHRHTNSILTEYDAKVIQSGCFCGTDEYALSLRKRNKPEQWVNIVNVNGLVCSYDVQL